MTPPELRRPVRSVDEAAERLRLLETALVEGHGPGDGVACFTTLYRTITENVSVRVSRSEFEDPQFVPALTVAFANRYLDALRNRARRRRVPRCWWLLFDRRGEAGLHPLQFAAAGVNAHITYDLPFAVTATCRRLRRPGPDSGSQRSDYDRVDAVFEEEMDGLLDGLWGAPPPGVLDPLDDWLGNQAVRLARDLAWRNALDLWVVRGDTAETARLDQVYDGLASFFGEFLLRPVRGDGATVRPPPTGRKQ